MTLYQSSGLSLLTLFLGYMLIGPNILFLHVINKGTVYNAITSGSWIISTKVPVAFIVGAGMV